MALLSKEQYEVLLEEQYNSLTKQDFGILMNTTREKIRGLIATDDIKLEKDEESDDIVLVSTTNPFYEIVFNTFQFASKTRRLSFKQYKCLAAFTKFKPVSTQNNFKQF